MATNSGRGNPIGARDGPTVNDAVPPVAATTKAHIHDVATITTTPGPHSNSNDNNSNNGSSKKLSGSTGTHDAGQDVEGMVPGATVPTKGEVDHGDDDVKK
ncbi:hypothetical protein B0T26DRAFT_684477 [Lasiosphaeria miniovina]|uniref:Uncharacterized protein n=1 Tax=Lasiosphaeria miniovina TaxID=1954250 RepID=A0AA40BFT2_9PEZI|nr:uncharacterized protein B0T26DRAFT_684477 [Lasiosphaeria miniovina]KAK0733456.1 hypothetical protein B0T26DRAFT_684477 [Lasiosphaeria miniovina]